MNWNFEEEVRRITTDVLAKFGEEFPGCFLNVSGIVARIPVNKETYGYVRPDEVVSLLKIRYDEKKIERAEVRGATFRSVHYIYRAKNSVNSK